MAVRGACSSLSARGSIGVDGEAHRVALICPVIDRVDAGRGRDRGVHRVPAMGWGFRAQVCRLFSGVTLPSCRSSKGEMAAVFFLLEMDCWEILQATPTWPPRSSRRGQKIGELFFLRLGHCRVGVWVGHRGQRKKWATAGEGKGSFLLRGSLPDRVPWLSKGVDRVDCTDVGLGKEEEGKHVLGGST